MRREPSDPAARRTPDSRTIHCSHRTRRPFRVSGFTLRTLERGSRRLPHHPFGDYVEPGQRVHRAVAPMRQVAVRSARSQATLRTERRVETIHRSAAGERSYVAAERTHQGSLDRSLKSTLLCTGVPLGVQPSHQRVQPLGYGMPRATFFFTPHVRDTTADAGSDDPKRTPSVGPPPPCTTRGASPDNGWLRAARRGRNTPVAPVIGAAGGGTVYMPPAPVPRHPAVVVAASAC